ncbi:MAG: hypothetical protein H7196_02875 [candidate division SR1 bacterium]|nr:hypothetical protein [candidate division SR1 bacterium]
MGILSSIVENLFLATKGVLPGQGETDDSSGKDYVKDFKDKSEDEQIQTDSMLETSFWTGYDR